MKEEVTSIVQARYSCLIEVGVLVKKRHDDLTRKIESGGMTPHQKVKWNDVIKRLDLFLDALTECGIDRDQLIANRPRGRGEK